MNAATVCMSCILESQMGIFATAIFHDVTRLHFRHAHAPSRCPNRLAETSRCNCPVNRIWSKAFNEGETAGDASLKPLALIASQGIALAANRSRGVHSEDVPDPE